VPDDPKSVNDILDRLADSSQGEEVSVGELTESLGHRSYGPFLIVPALIDISPIGAVPGLPTALAAIIILVSAQIAFGREHLWLPGFVTRRMVASDRVRRSVEKVRPVANWTDRWFHGRLKGLASGPFIRGAGVACALLALSVPPLEIIPLATTAPMAAIAMFGLALLVRDGLLMIAAYVLAIASVAIGVWLWTTQ
jgi:hypothetical protein